MSTQTVTCSGVSTPTLEPLGENSFTPPSIRAHFETTQQNMERLRI
ncbi:24055_t:CDS:1, partial [Dentiscutata erythropus]